MDGSKREYWLIFCDADHWTTWFLRSGFKHVMVLSRDKYNWILFNPKMNMYDYLILSKKIDVDVPEEYKKKYDYKIIKVVIDKSKVKYHWKVCMIWTCVTFAKYAIGLNGFIFTPRSLYKKLRKMMVKAKKSHKGIVSIKII